MTAADPLWEILSHSVTGANHVKAARQNQDSAATHPSSGPTDAVVLAVADGHGSERYVRSRVGAQLATAVMMEFGMRFMGAAREESFVTLKSFAEDAIPRALARGWRDRVVDDLDGNALDEEELAALGDPAVDPVNAYGTTVLGAAITDSVLVCWQLGDGDILLVSDDGEVTSPLAADEPRIGVETDSLVEPVAWRKMRTHWSPLSANQTALVILSTDGLRNSFTSERDFRAFGSDMLQRLRDQGIEQTSARLPVWLEQATSFSGDDVTVAAAWNRGQQPWPG